MDVELRQRLAFGRSDERFPVLVGDVAPAGQMVDRARDALYVLPARSVAAEQLVIAEPGEGATEEPERVEPGRIERRVSAEWSTGNTGVYGRLYARVAPTPDCKSDTSETIRVRRP